MFQGYYNLASNLIVQNRNMNVISNNMTNISTPGFKSDQLVQGTFRDEILYRFERDGRTPIGTTSRINTAEGVATDQTQGTLRATERALDLALSGKASLRYRADRKPCIQEMVLLMWIMRGILYFRGLEEFRDRMDRSG